MLTIARNFYLGLIHLALIIGVTFLVSACSLTKQARRQMPLHTQAQVGNVAFQLMDSLKSIGQDTSLLILKKCVGCIRGSKAHGMLIFVKNNELNLIEVYN